MGGGGTPQPNIVGGGQSPVPVPPFGAQPQMPNPFFVPGQSMKGGDLAGLPALQDVFNRPQSGPPMFPNSQSFPQPPLAQPWTHGLVNPIPLPQGGRDPNLAYGGPMLPTGPAIPAGPAPAPRPLPMPSPEPYEREIMGGDR